MSFPLQPQNNLIIVRPFKNKDAKVGSVWVPGVANANLETGEILAASKDSNHTVGEIVAYPSKTGVGQLINSDPCLWIKATEVWGVWDKSEWEKLSSGDE